MVARRCFVPRLGHHDVFGAEQIEPPVSHLVHDRFRRVRFEPAVEHQLAIHVVHAHRPFLCPADAPQEWGVARGNVLHVEERARGVADHLHQPRRCSGTMSGVILIRLRGHFAAP